MVTVHAVVGATGQQGGAVARAVLAAGASVRAVVRDLDADRAASLRRAGAELVHGDVTDAASLTAALRGADTLFAMTTPFTGRGPGGEIEDGRRLADAARAAGVGHVVYSSVGGAERSTGVPHFESKRRVEEYLGEIGVPATFVRPVFFMENLQPSDGDGGPVLALAMPGDVPLQLVAVRDIGAVAAAVMLDPSRVPGGAVEIAGDELTGEQMAATLGARFETLPTEALPDDDLKAMFRWFVDTRPSYRADFALTRELDPGVQDLRAWALARPTP